MATAYDFEAGARRAAEAVSDFRAGTNPHWNDSYLNLGASLMQADLANAHELEMWRLNNEYNTPAAQMQRMKDAGLNPMLFYGQGNPGNSSSAPGTHASDARISPHQDTLQRIAGAMNIINSFNQMLSQAFGVADQSLDLQLKQNEVSMSNWQNSVAEHYLLGYGSGRHAGQFGLLGNAQAGLDPYSKDFDAPLFSLLNRFGITSYYPRQITAEANAELSGVRQNYQNYYNEHILPLVQDIMEGKKSIQAAEFDIKQYTDDMLNSIPAPIRGFMEPFVRIILPLLLQGMRGK